MLVRPTSPSLHLSSNLSPSLSPSCPVAASQKITEIVARRSKHCVLRRVAMSAIFRLVARGEGGDGLPILSLSYSVPLSSCLHLFLSLLAKRLPKLSHAAANIVCCVQEEEESSKDFDNTTTEKVKKDRIEL